MPWVTSTLNINVFWTDLRWLLTESLSCLGVFWGFVVREIECKKRPVVKSTPWCRTVIPFLSSTSNSMSISALKLVPCIPKSPYYTQKITPTKSLVCLEIWLFSCLLGIFQMNKYYAYRKIYFIYISRLKSKMFGFFGATVILR